MPLSPFIERRDVKKNLKYLQNDRFAYVREFFDRIEEMRYTKKTMETMEDNPDKPILQKSCLSELHQSTLTLCDLYNALLAAIAVRPDFVNGGYDSGFYLWDRSLIKSDKKP